MSKKNKETALVRVESLKPEKILESKEKEILEYWLEDFKKNKLLKENQYLNEEILLKESKQFLDSLINTLPKTKIPDLDAKEFLPVLDMLRTLSRSRTALGYTMKDVAMYILSLKDSFQEYIQKIYPDKNVTNNKEIKSFLNLLDLLGIFVLESFVHEKENLLKRKDEEIKYLRGIKKFGELIGKSQAIQGVYKAIGQVLENDVTVLIQGETGTGKELVAHAIHTNSLRKNGPFIIVNCGAIPEKLLESELFGYEKGAFTGADDAKMGKFELAGGGTLFLDEIGELNLPLQVKLLRAIQYKEIEKLGSVEKIKVDARIIAASNKDLKKEVDEGKFRLDLFYRLNVFPICIPPLRERKEDIIPLALYFLKRANEEMKRNIKRINEEAVKKLLDYNWPGNVRELENKITRAVILAADDVLTLDLFFWENSDTKNVGGKIYLSGEIDKRSSKYYESYGIRNFTEVEKEHMLNTLNVTRGNIKKASKALGISRTTFYNKMKKYGIKN